MIGSLSSVQKRRLFDYWGYRPGRRQWEVHEKCGEYPIVAVRGGNRSGKSMLASFEGAAHIQIPNQRVWCVAPTYALSEKVYMQVKDFGVGKIGWPCVKDISKPPEMEIYNKTHVWGKSWEKLSSIEAEGVNKLIVDEWGFGGRLVWNRLVVRLDQPNSQALFILTPKGKNRYTRQWWTDRENDGDSFTMAMPTDECEYVSKKFLEMAERELGGKDAPAYREQIRGEFIAYGLLVYPEFDKGNIQRIDILNQKRSTRYYIGADKGYVHPTAAGFYGITSGDQVFKFAEYNKTYTTEQQNAAEIIKQAGNLQKHFKIKFDSCWYDPSAVSFAEELKNEARKLGLLEGGVRVFPAENAVEEGIELVRRLLIDNMFLVDPDCSYTKFNYQNYCYKKDSERIEKIHDDHCDCDRYVIMSRFVKSKRSYTYKVYG